MLTLVTPIVGKACQLIINVMSCGWLEPAELGTDMQEKLLAQVTESNKENVEPPAGLGLLLITPSHIHHLPKRLCTAESSYNHIPGWSPKNQKNLKKTSSDLLLPMAVLGAWQVTHRPKSEWKNGAVAHCHPVTRNSPVQYSMQRC